MTDTSQAIVERVRKLLELAKSDNVNESASAAAMAQELMLKYQLSAACLEDGPAPVERTAVQVDSGKKRACMWQAMLATVLGKHLHVQVVYVTGTDRIDAIGRGRDVAALALLYHWVRGQLELAASNAWATCNRALQRLDGGRVRFTDTFMRGARETIDERMAAQRRAIVAQASDPGTALVRLDAYGDQAAAAIQRWKDDADLRTRTTSRRVPSAGAGAYEAGRSAGHGVGLSPNSRSLPGRRA